MTATDCPADTYPSPTKRHKKAWRKPLAFRLDKRSTAGRRQRAHELALCTQLGQPYSKLPVWMRSTIDGAVMAMISLEQYRTAQSRGEPIDQEMAQWWAGILSRALETLGLTGNKPDPRAGLPTDAELRAKGINI